jgi:hypothetical protein
MVQAITLFNCIREVSSLNFGRITGNDIKTNNETTFAAVTG